VDREDKAQIGIDITQEQAVEFLQRLATDDDFRARFENQTQDLLREYGIDVPDDLMPTEVHAPPRGLLLEALQEIGVSPPTLVPFLPGAIVPFGPVPFAPFSFAYSLVFIALHRAQNQ
jgi:hypothetical protein